MKIVGVKYLLGCFIAIAFFTFSSCSVSKQIKRQAAVYLLNDTLFKAAHVGIGIYDLFNQQYLYNVNSDHYFIPSSNVKLFTLFTGLKYLPDSVVAARVEVDNETAYLQATGDPTFLHPDFKNQPLFHFLKQKEINVIRLYTPFAAKPLGTGWAWDDYRFPFSAERDPFPMYGNTATITYDYAGDSMAIVPKSIQPFVIGKPEPGAKWDVTREPGGHIYNIDTTIGDTEPLKKITMSLNSGIFSSRHLADTLHKTVLTAYNSFEKGQGFPLYSQPKDSLFKMMMHRSDNFFAEQTLLMVANEFVGEMNDVRIIDTLLKTDFRMLPQPPRWVDGSGLSRYNLFSPQDIIWVLNKLKADYGMERLKELLPSGNEGTLQGLYKGYEKNIWAKTGSMTNNLSLSGYLITRKNRLLSFSVMVNNHRSKAIEMKKQISFFLENIIDKY